LGHGSERIHPPIARIDQAEEIALPTFEVLV
jgi:hypothetical protein